MFPQGKGCFRLGKIAGISLYLHWSWFLVAYIEIAYRRTAYGSLAWNVAEYLVLFGIVLLHELGHSLACRQVGGKAEYIVLWPLGGVAVVNPPPRPGALLWSIAAGPLVNVVLLPVTIGLCLLLQEFAPLELREQVLPFCVVVAIINGGLLVLNLLPIYPLDGGQILYALLWFILGRVRALRISCVLGVIGAAGVLFLALRWHDPWYIVLAMFLGYQAIRGLGQARTLAWLQPAVDHLNRAMTLVQHGAAADALAECDLALGLIPQGHQLRENAQACRAMVLARLSQPALAICPKCGATLRPADKPGTEGCWHCGWSMET